MMTVKTRCPFCEEVHNVLVPESGYLKWEQGALIQDAFPNLRPEMREMLISGICPECWDKYLGAE